MKSGTNAPSGTLLAMLAKKRKGEEIPQEWDEAISEYEKFVQTDEEVEEEDELF